MAKTKLGRSMVFVKVLVLPLLAAGALALILGGVAWAQEEPPAEEPTGEVEAPAEPTEPVEAPAEPPVEPAEPPVEPAEPPVQPAEPEGMEPPAPGPEQPAGAEPGEGGVELPQEEFLEHFELPDPADVRLVLEYIGKELGLKFIYDETIATAGTISIKPYQKVRKSELYHVLETALNLKGLAMIRAGDWVRVMPADRTMMFGDLVGEGALPEPQIGETTKIMMIPLAHADATDVQDVLTPYLTENGMVRPMPDQKMIIVTEYVSRMELLQRLIKLVDVPPKQIITKIIELEHTQAPDIAYKLNNYLQVVNQPKDRIVPVRTVTPTQVRLNYTTAKVQPTLQPFIEVDERTNRLFMYGRPEDLAELEERVKELDVERKEFQQMKQYPLEFLLADDALSALVDLGLAESEAGAAPRRTPTRTTTVRSRTPTPTPAATTGEVGGKAAAPKITIIQSTNTLVVKASPEEHERIAAFLELADVEPPDRGAIRIIPLDRRDAEEVAEWLKAVFKADTIDPRTKTPVPGIEGAPIIVAATDTNSIIANATPSQHSQIQALIKSLDATQPQVLLECILVEVTSRDEMDIGLELETLSVVGQTSSNRSIFGSTDFEMSARDPATGLRVLTSASVASPGGTIAFLNDGIVNALLHAMEEKSKGRVLSKPRIVVENNGLGTIKAIDREPTVTVETLNNVTTSRFAGYEEAGTTLQIEPRISESDFLTLKILADVSTFTAPSPAVGVPPPQALRNIETEIVVPDQRTIVIGGLTGKRRLEGEDKIPLLGDIPLLGELFKHKSNEDVNTTIYLFVKASILRESDFQDHFDETNVAREDLPDDARELDPTLSSEAMQRQIERLHELQRRRAAEKARMEAERLITRQENGQQPDVPSVPAPGQATPEEGGKAEAAPMQPAEIVPGEPVQRPPEQPKEPKRKPGPSGPIVVPIPQ